MSKAKEMADARAIVEAAALNAIARGNTLPPDPEDQNDDRAMWGQISITAFERHTGTDPEDALSDLLCDLMHLCDRRAGEDGWNFDSQVERAREHYTVETEALPVDCGIMDEPLMLTAAAEAARRQS